MYGVSAEHGQVNHGRRSQRPFPNSHAPLRQLGNWGKISVKQVPVGTTMRPGSRLMVAERKEEVVVDSVDDLHEA